MQQLQEIMVLIRIERIIFLVSEQFKKQGGLGFNQLVDIWYQSYLGGIFSEGDSFWELIEIYGEVRGSVCSSWQDQSSCGQRLGLDGQTVGS